MSKAVKDIFTVGASMVEVWSRAQELDSLIYGGVPPEVQEKITAEHLKIATERSALEEEARRLSAEKTALTEAQVLFESEKEVYAKQIDDLREQNRLLSNKLAAKDLQFQCAKRRSHFLRFVYSVTKKLLLRKSAALERQREENASAGLSFLQRFLVSGAFLTAAFSTSASALMNGTYAALAVLSKKYPFK
jgi:hypothetical protein